MDYKRCSTRWNQIKSCKSLHNTAQWLKSSKPDKTAVENPEFAVDNDKI